MDASKYFAKDTEETMELEVLQLPGNCQCDCDQNMTEGSTFYTVCDFCLQTYGSTVEVEAEMFENRMELESEICRNTMEVGVEICGNTLEVGAEMEVGTEEPQINCGSRVVEDVPEDEQNIEEVVEAYSIDEVEDNNEERWRILVEEERRKNKLKIDLIEDQMYALWLRSPNRQRIIVWAATLVKLLAWTSVNKMAIRRHQLFGNEMI